MRVIHLTRDFPPRKLGGLSTAVGGLVAELAQQECESLVLSFDNYRPKKGAGRIPEVVSEAISPSIRVLRIESASQLPEATNLAQEYAGDIVHLHHEMLWDLAHEIASSNSAPIVYSVHVLQSEQNRLRDLDGTMSSQSQGRALLWATSIVAPSEEVARLLHKEAPSRSDRLCVIRLGTDLPQECAAEVEAVTLPKNSESPLLLYAGRFADINGFNELLEALPVIFGRHPKLRAVIAGGLPGNQRAQRRWQARWQEIAGNTHSRLEFVGWQSDIALRDLYHQADMLIVPSWFETFGQVALEGMVHGAPLIVSDGGALPELADSECATTIAIQDSDAIIQAVDEVLANPELVAQKRVCAMKRARRDYRWFERAAEFVRHYRELLD